MPASNVWPVLAAPIPLAETTIPYDEVLIWFSMSPRTDDKRLDATFSIVLRPYRRLADGTLEMSPEAMQTSYAVGSARDLKQAGNNDAMKCAKDVMAAVMTYVATLG